MKEIYNERFQERYYTEILDNGLQVVLWQKPDFEKSFFLMATPLGALDLNQEGEGKTYCFPAGIAHFLEHKMFEDEDKDVMEFFAKMGANVNAFTSYHETAYYFSSTKDPKEPLNLLLDFVQELKITEKSVEKEKGIIIQELEMYQQMSDARIINETLQALYKEHPLIYDIGGDAESVTAITKSQLEQCYNLNYHPSRMVLIGVSGSDPETLMETIKENQSKKPFVPITKVKRKEYQEQIQVYEKKRQIFMDVSIPKINLSFKMEGIADAHERNRMEWCYKMLFDLYFTSLNPKFQSWLDEEIINDSFYFEIDFGSDYGLIMFYSETNKINQFKDMIFNVLRQIDDIDENKLSLLRKRYFGQNINALNDHKKIAVNYMRNYFAGLDFFSSLEVVENIQKQDLLDAVKRIQRNHYSEVVIYPNASNT